jgi:hypothetical protein
MCGGTPQTATYKIIDGKSAKVVERKIKVKDLNTLSKWAKGAVARRRLRKLIVTARIASKLKIGFSDSFDLDLKYPEYHNEKLVDSEEMLFTQKEIFLQLDYERGGKDLAWNNFFVEIGKNKKYQG